MSAGQYVLQTISLGRDRVKGSRWGLMGGSNQAQYWNPEHTLVKIRTRYQLLFTYVFPRHDLALQRSTLTKS